MCDRINRRQRWTEQSLSKHALRNPVGDKKHDVNTPNGGAQGLGELSAATDRRRGRRKLREQCAPALRRQLPPLRRVRSGAAYSDKNHASISD